MERGAGILYSSRTMSPEGSPASREAILARIDELVSALQASPDDSESLGELAEVADAWVAADGLSQASTAESRPRIALAQWLTGLAQNGSVIHLGWRDGALAATLAAAGSKVFSFLDHPGRALAAAVRHGSENLAFSALEEAQSQTGEYVGLVVVETAGIQTVLPLQEIKPLLHDGTWLAILGMPVLWDESWLLEAGSFYENSSGVVVPCAPGQAETMIGLYRKLKESRARPQVAREVVDSWATTAERPDLAAEIGKLKAGVDEFLP